MKRSILINLLLLCSISIFAQDIVVPPRTCAVCKETKPATEFSGNSYTCKACAQKAAAEKKRKEQQAAERRRQQQLERERVAREQAEKERVAREQAEKERIAKILTFIKMVPVEGGTFTMGSTAEQGSDYYRDEKPTHQVTVSSFSIGQTEVTQELWEAVMGSNPSNFKGAKRPVEGVSWNDCQAFITKLNQLTGKKFRLPTEAEWEYAARGGKNSKGYKYAGSNTIDEVAWYTSNPGAQYGDANFWILSDNTHDVATKKPNELGLYDMSGNVWEWCQDRFGKYSSSSQTNPTGPSSGSRRVLRGGGWGDDARDGRVSNRSNFYSPDYGCNVFGLRLAL